MNNDGITDGSSSPNFRWTPSPNIGEGEKTMQKFIHQQMTNIVNPIAEHLLVLQKHTKHLALDVERIESKSDANGKKLEDHGGMFSIVSSDLAGVRNDLGRTKQEFVSTQTMLSEMIADHGETKAALVAADDALQQTVDSHREALRQSMDSNTFRITHLDVHAAEAGKRIAELDVQLSDLSRSCDEMNDRHHRNTEDLHQTKTTLEKTRQSFHKFSTVSDKNDKDIKNSLGQLRSHAQSIEAEHSRTRQQVVRHGQVIETTTTELEQVIHLIGGVKKDMSKLDVGTPDSRANSPTDGATTFLERLRNMELDIRGIRDRLEKEKVAVRLADLAGVVETNTSAINKNMSSINDLQVVQKTHDELFTGVDRRAVHLKEVHDELKGRVDVTCSDTRDLEISLTGAAAKIDLHNTQLEQHHEELRSTSRRVDVTESNILALREDLTVTQDTLSHVSDRSDLSHEYLQGLGKGLQDTHKHVSATLPRPSPSMSQNRWTASSVASTALPDINNGSPAMGELNPVAPSRPRSAPGFGGGGSGGSLIARK